MTSGGKQYLPGIDILKFILAVLIVSGHCSLFVEYTSLYEWWGRLTAIAVPIFFGISSYLFFRKVFAVQRGTDTCPMLTHTLKRLAILFACWYILVLPMTYSLFFSVATLKETIFAIFLSCTTRGYWFIKALFINTALLYFCRRRKALIICFIAALCVYLYCSYNYVYHYNSFLLSIHPYYSFYYHTAAFCLGTLFAKYQDKLHFDLWNQWFLISAWLISYLILELIPLFKPLFLLLSMILLFPVFYQQDYLFSPKTHKTLRNMSIILYMVQFVLIWLYNGACELWLQSDSIVFVVLQHSIARFIIVLVLAIVIAKLILKYEKRPKLSFLCNLH